MLFSCWLVLFFFFASFFFFSAFCSDSMKAVFTINASSWFDCPSCLFALVSSLSRLLFSVLLSMLSLGCDFFDSKTNMQIHERTFRNIFFWMVSFVFSGNAL